MSTTNHTTGKWYVVEGFKRLHVNSESPVGPVEVATIDTDDIPDFREQEVRANARLIAAAPELHQHLRGIIEAMERGEIMVCDMNSRALRAASAYLISESKAVLAKATPPAAAAPRPAKPPKLSAKMIEVLRAMGEGSRLYQSSWNYRSYLLCTGNETAGLPSVTFHALARHHFLLCQAAPATEYSWEYVLTPAGRAAVEGLGGGK